jgi:DNA-binding CsgD family transcriptional regulator
MKQIASELAISFHTIKHHLTKVRRKLGAQSSAQAVWILYIRETVAASSARPGVAGPPPA